MHRSPEKPQGRRSEAGYALIGAMWFLLLSASIVAVLMARASVDAREVAGQRHAITERYALESAIETALADIVMNGPASFAIRSPAELEVTIDGRVIRVSASSEAGRADANTADADAINARLRDGGIEPAERVRIGDAIMARRRAGERIGSLAELRGVIAGAVGEGSAGRLCARDHLTLVTSLTRPSAAADQGGAGALTAAYPVRLLASDGDGGSLVAIVRISGRLDQAVQVVDRVAGLNCTV